jgi:UDP-glucose 4-epimerase
MRVLVTGGAGFIGSRLAEELLDRGREVVVVDDLSEGRRAFVPDAAGFVEADLKDRQAIDDVLSQGFDRVYHLAANRDVSVQEEDREVDVRENINATHNLLEAMYEHGVDDLVFTSSSVVYGEADQFPTPEDYSPLEPISLYGASKLSAESLACVYARSFGIETTVLRLANIIGSRSDHGVIYDFVQKLEDDPSSLFVLGDGKQRKSYLHVDDCVGATIQAAEKREDMYEVYNVGNTDSVSVSRIAEMVIEEYGCDAEIEYEGGEKGWTGDVTEMLLAIDRLVGLDWQPGMSSAEAVRKTARGLVNTLD